MRPRVDSSRKVITARESLFEPARPRVTGRRGMVGVQKRSNGDRRRGVRGYGPPHDKGHGRERGHVIFRNLTGKARNVNEPIRRDWNLFRHPPSRSTH